MKKYIALLASALLLTGCGETEDSSSSKMDKRAPASDLISSYSSESLSESSDSTITDTQTAEYPKDYEISFDDTERSVISKATLLVTGPTGESSLEDMLDKDVMASGTVGLVGSPVAIELEGEKGTVTFTVDKDALGDVPFENLIVLKSGHGMSFDEVASAVKEDKISFEITESDTYMLVDAYQYGAAIGADVGDIGHGWIFKNNDFEFKVTLPEGITVKTISSTWKANRPSDGEQEMMYMEMLRQDDPYDSNIQMQLLAYRYPNEADLCEDPKPMISFEELFDEEASNNSDLFEITGSESWELNDGRSSFYLEKHHPYDPEKKTVFGDVIPEQTTITAFYSYSNDTYIMLRFYIANNERSDIDACIESVKSFTYY